MAEEQATDQPELDPVDFLDSKNEPPAESPPSEFAGKSREELERIIADQRTQIGKQSNEVGDVRRELRALKGQVEQVGQVREPEPKPAEIDYFGDPANAIKQSIEDSPRVRQLETQMKQQAAQNAADQLLWRHNDIEQVLGSSEFKDWVGQSAMRTQAYGTGIDGLNVQVLDELVSDFKKSNTDPKLAALAQQSPQEAVKQAATGGATGTGAARTQPTLSREQMIDLRLRKPDEYRRLKAEGKIAEAYRSGRVK